MGPPTARQEQRQRRHGATALLLLGTCCLGGLNQRIADPQGSTVFGAQLFLGRPLLMASITGLFGGCE
jgi:hypothetical protein